MQQTASPLNLPQMLLVGSYRKFAGDLYRIESPPNCQKLPHLQAWLGRIYSSSKSLGYTPTESAKVIKRCFPTWRSLYRIIRLDVLHGRPLANYNSTVKTRKSAGVLRWFGGILKGWHTYITFDHVCLLQYLRLIRDIYIFWPWKTKC